MSASTAASTPSSATPTVAVTTYRRRIPRTPPSSSRWSGKDGTGAAARWPGEVTIRSRGKVGGRGVAARWPCTNRIAAKPPCCKPGRAARPPDRPARRAYCRSNRCSNAARFATDSPRSVRHAYSRRIDEAKPELQQRVEVAVRRLEHLPEEPVDLVGRHRRAGHAADEVDVADPVEHVVHAVEPGVALQQEPVDDLVVLVRPPAHERLDEQRVLAHHQPAVRPQTPRPGQRHQELAGPPLLVVDPRRRQRRGDDLRGAHGIPAAARSPASCRRANSAAAPSYVSSSASVVRSQENRCACATAPRASVARRAGSSATAANASAHGSAPVPVDEQPRPPVRHRHRQPAHARGHHRRPAGLRLQRDQPERLVVARHRDDVRGPEDRREPGAGLGRRKRTTSSSPRRAASCCSAGRLGQPAARRPARHEHHQPRPQRGVALQQGGRGVQQHVRGLQRLDPSGEGERRRRPGRSSARGARRPGHRGGSGRGPRRAGW